MRTQNISLGAVFILLGFLITLILTRTLTRSLDILTKGAESVAKERFDHRVDIRRGDELELFANSFNLMTRRLKESVDEVIRSKTYIHSIITNMIDTLIVVDPEGRIKTLNPATCHLLGYTEDELIGQPVENIFAEEDPPS